MYLAQAVLPRMPKNSWSRFLTITWGSVRQPVEGSLLSNALRAGVTGLGADLGQRVCGLWNYREQCVPRLHANGTAARSGGNVGARSGATTEELFAGWKQRIPAGAWERRKSLRAWWRFWLQSAPVMWSFLDDRRRNDAEFVVACVVGTVHPGPGFL